MSQIAWFACTFPPSEWAFCMGQTLPISQYSALFSLIGDYFGGDARTTVGLPDLRGRSPIGSNFLGQPTPPLVGLPQGYKTGFQTRTLSVSNLPQHNHTATFSPRSSGGTLNLDVQIKVNSDNATVNSPGANDPSGNPALSCAAPVSGLVNAFGYNSSTPDVALTGVESSGTVSGIAVDGIIAMSNTGNADAFSVQNPITALNACINLEGIYPSRN